MNKTVIGFLAVAILTAGLSFGLLVQHRQNTGLIRALSKLESELRTQSKTVVELNALLGSANEELAAMHQATSQKHSAPAFEAKQEPEPPVEAAQAALEKAKSEIVPPNVTANLGQKTYVFPRLPNVKRDVVLTNAEFRTLAGRRLTFRVAEGPRAFDVDELHPGVLAYLDIDPEAVKQKYELQKQRERIQQMADAAAKAEALRQWEELAAKLRVEEAKAAVEREKAGAYRAQRIATALQAVNDERKTRAAERQAAAQEDTAWQAQRQANAIEMQRLMPPPPQLQIQPTQVRIVP